MVEVGRAVPILLGVLLSIKVNSGFLDLEELKSVHYGISIINEPVIIGKEPPGAILLRSKFGQQYQCSYPDRQSEDEKAKQEQQEAIETGIPDLLKPLGQQACLVHPKDWWTYELCYGKFVKQYHVENGKVAGNLIYLGFYQSEFDWDNITEQDKKRKYHSQSYTNGTTCDLTNKQRQVEVRFECEEGSVDYIHEISEAETCVYTMIVRTPRVCKHPYLQKPLPSVPIPITCNPLVTPEQYQNHLDAKLDELRLREERRQQEIKKLKEAEAEKENYIKMYKVIREEDSTITKMEIDDEDGDSGSIPSTDTDTTTSELKEVQEQSTMESLLRDTFGLKDKGNDEEYDDQPLLADKKMKIKVFKDHSELRNYLKTLVAKEKSKNKDVDMEDEDETEDSEAEELVEAKEDELSHGENTVDAEESLDGKDEGEIKDPADKELDEDEKLIQEFSKELSDIVDTEEKRVHIARYKETLKSAMQAKFSDIIDEAELELGDEMDVPGQKDVAFKALASTLNKLIKKVALTKLLKKVEKEKDQMEQELHLAEQRLQDETNDAGKMDSSQSATQNQGEDLEPEDQENQPQADGFTVQDIQTNIDSSSESDTPTDGSETTESDQIVENIKNSEGTRTLDEEPLDNTHSIASSPKQDTADATGRDLTEKQVPSGQEVHNIENRVRVRVTRIKHSKPAEGDSGPSAAVAESSGDKKTLELPEEQRKQLETTVKTELEKAGLETQGQKIEVKIITAGYFDTNKEGVHVLSEEESSAFNNMIVSILGGNNQAAQEVARQRRMEESYSYVWGQGQETKQSKLNPSPTQTPPTQETPSQDSNDTPNTAQEAPTEPPPNPPE